MKIKLQLLLLLIPVIGSAQNLVRCNDTTSFSVHQMENFHCYIKLSSKVSETGDSRVIAVDGFALQSLVINKQDYTSNGKEDIPILTNYMIKETEYFTGVFKEKLNLMMEPVEISRDKKAVIWYFDFPEKVQKQAQPGETPAIKQVSISMVTGDFVFSIGATQFKGQSLDDLKKLLAELIMTTKYGTGLLDLNGFCSK